MQLFFQKIIVLYIIKQNLNKMPHLGFEKYFLTIKQLGLDTVHEMNLMQDLVLHLSLTKM